nr:hypothetical protein [Tanacetum cinerariifolium]
MRLILAPKSARAFFTAKDDLEEWYEMGDCGTPSSDFMGVSSPLCLSSFVVPWVVDGVGAD